MIRIISKQPKCITCGRLLDEWNPFVEDKYQEHPECTGQRFAEDMIRATKQALQD